MRHIHAKFSMHNSPQSPDIRQNSDGGISDFQISGQSLLKETVIISEPVMILT